MAEMIYRLYYAPWHRNRLLWPMTDDEAANRWAHIIEIKPEPELWTRLLAFQPVKDPTSLPLPVQQASAAWQQASAALQQAFAAWQQAFAARQQASAARQQAVLDHWDAIDAQRKREYPDAPDYRKDTGLVFEDGYVAPD